MVIQTQFVRERGCDGKNNCQSWLNKFNFDSCTIIEMELIVHRFPWDGDNVECVA